MPSARVTRRGATSSRTPRPMLNQPSARARRSDAPSELGPGRRTLGSPSERAMLETYLTAFPPGCSGLQDDLDAAVLLVAEHLVHLGPLLELGGMGDHEGRVDLAFLDAAQQVVGPAVDVGLAHAEGQAL